MTIPTSHSTSPPKQPTDADELIVALHRMVKALGRRASTDGDLEALAGLKVLEADIRSELERTVANLRNHEVYPASWGELAGAMGVTSKAVRKRYGHVGGRRQPGGQPGNLR